MATSFGRSERSDDSSILELRSGSFPVPPRDPVLMSVFLIVGAIVLAAWFVETTVFLASYGHIRSP